MASVGRHDAIGIAVHLGDYHLPILPGQSGRSGQLLSGFVCVQLVNGEGKGPVLIQCHFLGCGVQISNRAEPAPLAIGDGAVALVIVHGAGADLIDLDGVRTGPIKIIVGQERLFALVFELFIGIRCEFCD